MFFRIRADTTTGKDLLPPAAYRVGTPGDNFYVGAVPLGRLPKNPTAGTITKAIFGKRSPLVDLYSRENATTPYSSANVVPVDKRGLTKNLPLLFVDRNKDSVVDAEDVPDGGAFPTYNKKLTNIRDASE